MHALAVRLIVDLDAGHEEESFLGSDSPRHRGDSNVSLVTTVVAAGALWAAAETARARQTASGGRTRLAQPATWFTASNMVEYLLGAHRMNAVD